jgi:hypothetical protein
MVPGAAHRIADHDSVRQRRAVVGAVGADGHDFFADAGKHHRLAIDVPLEKSVLAEGVNGDALRQVGSGFLRLM